MAVAEGERPAPSLTPTDEIAAEGGDSDPHETRSGFSEFASFVYEVTQPLALAWELRNNTIADDKTDQGVEFVRTFEVWLDRPLVRLGFEAVFVLPIELAIGCAIAYPSSDLVTSGWPTVWFVLLFGTIQFGLLFIARAWWVERFVVPRIRKLIARNAAELVSGLGSFILFVYGAAAVAVIATLVWYVLSGAWRYLTGRRR
jgi:hypothetical protein